MSAYWLPATVDHARAAVVEWAIDKVLTIETDQAVASWVAAAGSPPGSAWCACFAWNAWYLNSEPPLGDGACETWHVKAATQNRLLPVGQAQPGDVILFDFGTQKNYADHCGIVARIASDAGVPYVYTIEGNSTSGGGPKGNGVYAHRWLLTDPAIIGVVSLTP